MTPETVSSVVLLVVSVLPPREKVPEPLIAPIFMPLVVNPLMSMLALPFKMTRAVPPSADPVNVNDPPDPPLLPPLPVSVALPAVAVPVKVVVAPNVVALVPPLLVIVAEPAEEAP